jgi:hypothetical protein
MATRVNPFHELYVGESIGPEKFVNLFSDIIVEQALALFQPGHVILKGLPGAGKSMLLNLLRPSIRLAYAQSGKEFPVPSEFSKFIGAGINLKRSGICDFGQRPILNDIENSVTPIYFGDFLNYWIVADILATIHKIHTNDVTQTLAKAIGISYSNKSLDEFAKALSNAECWQNYFKNVDNLEEFTKQVNNRITSYRSFLNYNLNELPIEIQNSKTLIGAPISRCVELLRRFKIINEDVEVFIRIDQYEELAWLDDNNQNLGSSYQAIIRKLLAMRDSNVSYRIGTRHFAWDQDKTTFGSNARLEKKRNYKEISIDSFLRRRENARLWIFPKFAEDIFTRRIKLSPYKFSDQDSENLLSFVFGRGYNPNKSAENYLPKHSREKAIRIEQGWPKPWKVFLTNLAEEDPLSARLAEAWARQKGKEDITNQKKWEKPYPWDTKNWWKKERIEQALMQIASRNQQQLIWYGKDDILGLSGGHILIFLSLCQHIFDVWMRDQRIQVKEAELKLPEIDSVIQSAGIRESSIDWFEDISNENGGKERKNFISYIGRMFFKTMVEDKSMSYPGNNGFSLTIEDLEKSPKVYQFLKDASDYGDLYDAPHTTKSSDKKARIKWYLNPILSPYFKIPYSHTKEPIYCNLEMFQSWLLDAGVFDEAEMNIEVKINKKKKKEGN